MRGGGAGSAHRSCEDVEVGVGDSSIVDGVGDGGTAGSAHSSLGDIGLVVVVDALLVVGWVVGVVVRGVAQVSSV